MESATILSIFIYDDNDVEKTLSMCSKNKYGLTGAIFTDSIENMMFNYIFICHE